MLGKLCDMIGVSGYETDIVNSIYSSLKFATCDELYIDNIGNLVCLKKGTAGRRKNMVIAHVDEVGFQVIRKNNEHQYAVRSLGNIRTWNAYQQRVCSEKSSGMICAIDAENLKAFNYDNLYLESLSGEATVETGTVFSFLGNFRETEEYYLGKALDNRISCFCLYEMIRADIQTKEDIYYVFSVQEEIGMRGSRVAKTTIQPDLCINLDVTPEGEMNSVKMGEGVGIKISDSMSVSSSGYVLWAKDIAKKNDIRFQMEVSDCGTNEMIISNELDRGHFELGISIPCKYIHTANSIVKKSDFEETMKLMKLLISNL